MLSRQILYFTIGILISFIMVDFVYSEEGFFETNSDCYNAALARQAAYFNPSYCLVGGGDLYSPDVDRSKWFGVYYTKAKETFGGGYYFYKWQGFVAKTPEVWTQYQLDILDTDGDGIPDYLDMYPNDPTPYKVKLQSYKTDDCSASGNHVYGVWVTDRGDYYTRGTDNDCVETLVVSVEWIDPPTDPGLGNPGDAPPSEPISIPSPPPPGEDPEDPGTGTDPGDDTNDNEVLNTINDNIQTQINNQIILIEYQDIIDRSIRDMNDNNIIREDKRKTAAEIKDNLDDLEKEAEKAENDAEVQQAQSNLNNIDVTGSYSTISSGGDLVHGEDYDDISPLADESFLVNFIANNPLTTALNNSGFNGSNPVCSTTLDLGSMGVHTLSLCEFEDGFRAFGVLLLSFCSLGSLFIIVRR